MNRRILGLLGAALLAIIGTVMIVAYVHGADARALDGQKTIQVFVVKKTVPAGTPAEQLGARVKLESIVRESEAEGAVTDVKDLKGLVSGATLVPGEQLVRARFVDATAFRATGASVEVPDGLSQITIKLDPERALGGVLTPGAKVGVTASFDSDSGAQAESHMILHDVLVTNVQANDDGSGSKTFNTSSGDKSDTKAGASPTGMVLVTLALDVPSAEHVVFAAERGSVWLSLEPDNVGTGGSKIVNRDNALS